MDKLFNISYSVSFGSECKEISVSEDHEHRYHVSLCTYRFPYFDFMREEHEIASFKEQFEKLSVLKRDDNDNSLAQIKTYLDFNDKEFAFTGIDHELDKLMNSLFIQRELKSISFSDTFKEEFTLSSEGVLTAVTESGSYRIESSLLERALDMVSTVELFYDDSDSAVADNRYFLYAEYIDGDENEVYGPLDLKGLPASWSEFVDLINSVTDCRIPLKAFDKKVYSVGRQCEEMEDNIIAVQFQEGGQEYQYRTPRSDIKVGDRVIVPVGRERTMKIVTVTDTSRDAPIGYPYENMKRIIRKVDEPGYIPRECSDIRAMVAERETYELLKKCGGSTDDSNITRVVLIGKYEYDKDAFKEAVHELDIIKPLIDNFTFSLDHYIFERMKTPPAKINSLDLLLRWYALSRELSDLFIYTQKKELAERVEKALRKLGLVKKDGGIRKSSRWPEKNINRFFVDYVRKTLPELCEDEVERYIFSN